MSRAFSPRPGRAWPAPARASTSWLDRSPTRPTPVPADEVDAELARDLSFLVECGLVVPIPDGLTVRFALSPDADAERAGS